MAFFPLVDSNTGEGYPRQERRLPCVWLKGTDRDEWVMTMESASLMVNSHLEAYITWLTKVTG